MEWGDHLKLNLAPMDHKHEEFVTDYQALLTASPAEFIELLDVFIEHTVAHFDQENCWMELVGFPGCHRAEHDRVLEVMRQVRQAYAQGDLFLGKQLVEELPIWFEGHVNGMDAALAFHIATIGFDTATGTIGKPELLGRSDEGASCTCTGASVEAST